MGFVRKIRGHRDINISLEGNIIIIYSRSFDGRFPTSSKNKSKT